MNERRRAVAFGAIAVTIGLIVWATLTPDGGSVEAKASVWCLTCESGWLADAVSNVALFVPLGAVLAWHGMRLPGAVLCGALLSLAIETLQAWLPIGRTPTVADWLTNSAGTAVGAWLFARHVMLLRPGVREARRLALAWGMLAAAVLTGSWWALSPALPSVGVSARVVPSPLPFTPGHGWYAALADSASVNGVAIPHGGTGPVIAAMPRVDSVTASVRVRGQDERLGVVPIVFVHAPGDTLAHLLLGQRGNDAVVGTWLNAGRVGLFSPMLAVHGVFAAEARAGDAPLWLEAGVAGRTLMLTVRDGARSARSQRMTLSPLHGWALVQSIVRVDSPLAPVVTVLWVVVLVGPVGYWMIAKRTGRA